MYDFPYPILKPDLTSSYRPDCNFEILDKEGNPAGYSVSFTVIYQDTPPYVPGVNQDKDKYTVEVDVEFRANYNN